MNRSFAIRQAEFRDAAAVFALVKKYPDTVLARPIGDIVQNIDRFLVCEEDERLIGAVSWQILPEIGSPKSPSVEIKSLCVEPDRVRRGIGRALVERAIERIRPLRPVQILVLTFAPEFFDRLGFRETPKAGLMHKIYAGCINCTRYESPFTCPEIAMILRIEPPDTTNEPILRDLT